MFSTGFSNVHFNFILFVGLPLGFCTDRFPLDFTTKMLIILVPPYVLHSLSTWEHPSFNH